MNATARIAAAVAGGYLLGRTKKLKLAITVGSMLAGQRISTNPRELLRQGAQLIDSNPELAKLSDQVRSQLLQALRAAAVSTASDSMNQLSDAIHSRSERLAVGQGEDGSADEEQEEPEDLEEEPEDEDTDEDTDEDEDAEDEDAEDEDADEPEDEASDEDEDAEDEQPAAKKRPARRSSGSRQRGGSSRKPPAKKTAKAPAKKASAKKTSKKSSASRSTKG